MCHSGYILLQHSFFHLVGTQVQDVTLLMEDATERIRLGEEVVKTQRHLASIVESAGDIILSTDSNGFLLTWNTTAERLTGLSSNQVTGTLFFNLFHEAWVLGHGILLQQVFLNLFLKFIKCHD